MLRAPDEAPPPKASRPPSAGRSVLFSVPLDHTDWPHETDNSQSTAINHGTGTAGRVGTNCTFQPKL
jgi:hypothetical protein